jgi:hypothetical protein
MPGQWDDYESLMYSLIFMLKGNLPWKGLKRKTSLQLYEAVYKIKCDVKLEDLCSGCPKLFQDLLEECKTFPKCHYNPLHYDWKNQEQTVEELVEEDTIKEDPWLDN